MSDQTAPAVSSVIDDIYSLVLVDGLPAESGGKTLKYRTVKLRETTVADERAAARLAERLMVVGGVPKLIVSESDFRYALTMRHCEKFVCDSMEIPLAILDLDLFGKLSTHDLQLIEERVFLVTLAAQVRYGTVTPQEFEAYARGQQANATAPSPQHVGQTAAVGAPAAHAGAGPALLADYAGDAANRSPASDGG
jgi:phage FluMu protein gp41